MNTIEAKRLFFAMALAITLMLSSPLPWMQTTVLAADASRTALNIRSENDLKETIKLDMEKVTSIEIRKVDMTKDDSGKNLTTLLRGCTNLQSFQVENCNLSGFDFSVLNNRESLTELRLINVKINKIPDRLTLKNLRKMCLSKNDLSAQGAFENLTAANFPKLTLLWLDECKISNLDFISRYGEREAKLTSLSLGNNYLRDDSLEALLDMSGGSLSELKSLWLGIKAHENIGATSGHLSFSKDNSTNRFTNSEKLALIPMRFKNLTYLDISALQITSLKPFADAGVIDDIEFDFSLNKISDFAGLENITGGLYMQNISLSGNFAPEWECEMPELIKNILDKNHELSGSLVDFKGCRLSDDGTKLVFEPNIKTASVNVQGGRLFDSTIRFEPLRLVPPYTIPQGLTAVEGENLAMVILPEGFVWKDSALSVGLAGTKSFKAVYTPTDIEKYITIEIDIPVTVKKAVTDSTEPVPEPVPDTNPVPDTEPVQDESNLTGNQIESRKDLSILLATGKQKGKNGIELTWKKKSGCSGYEVYWSYCDGERNFKKAKTVKSTGKRSYTHKNLKSNRAYKYYIATYKMKNGKKVYQSKSPTIHVAMKQEKRTNVKSISVNKTKVSLKAKKTFQIKATAKAENKKKKLLAHTDKFRYYTNDRKVATVTKKGKIQAKKKGSCSIFVIANNGVSKEIKVTVK